MEMLQDSGELHVPLLSVQQEINEIGTAEAGSQHAEGDVEQGLVGCLADTEVVSKSEEEEGIEAAARASTQCGPVVYIIDILRLAIFYWAIVADALLLKELYIRNNLVLAGIATGFTVCPHVLMSLLLIIRQGWLQAASQACGFILTLNPFESLTPIPQGILGLFVISIGFIAYVLIAASGLIFVAYCVVCYLVTALLFSLLILDLAAVVITVAPGKGIFKYTDLVYTENFKFSRLVLQAWLQSAPELVVLGIILYRDASPAGPAVVVASPILWQAVVAHTVNVWDKTLLFRSAAASSGAGFWGHLASLLAVKGSSRLSLPVLRENLSKVLRGTGGNGAVGLGSVVHLSSAEEAPDTDSDAAASMVPEYLTPTNGGLLSPGQLMALSRAVFGRYGGPGVAELVLELTPDVRVGKLLSEVLPAVPNLSSLRLMNASIRGKDAGSLPAALLMCGSLRALQLHQVLIDERGAQALTQLLQHTPTLQQLDLCRCKLRRRAPQALSQGLRSNKTLRQLNLAGVQGLDEAATSAIAAAVACSKVLTALNMAFVQLGMGAVDSLVQALKSSSSLQVLAVSQRELPVEGAKKLLAAITALKPPKAPPSLTCNLTLGTFTVEGLDKVKWLAVEDQDALIADAWQLLAGTGAGNDTCWDSGETLQPTQVAGAVAGASDPAAATDQAATPAAGEVASGSAEAAALLGHQAQGSDGSSSGAVHHPAAALDLDFMFTHETNIQSQTDLLWQLVSKLEKEDRKDVANSLQHYIQCRDEYVKTHNGRYVQISDEGVKPLDITRRCNNDLGFDSKYDGLLIKVGNEIVLSPEVAAAAADGSAGRGSDAAAVLPTSAWFSNSDASNSSSSCFSSITPAMGGNSGSSPSNGRTGSNASTASAAYPGAPCPSLVFVVTQEEVVKCMVQTPLLFHELDTLDLTGLGIGDEGAAGLAKVLVQNPAVRRVVLADNKIGEEGGNALSGALDTNTSLQVLDLSSNEFSESGVVLLAAATCAAAGLKQLRLLGNKIPFGLHTLRQLMEAEGRSPHCHLVLVEEPSEVLDDLEKQGDTQQAARAADFFKRQEQYRQQRRQRMQARQQRLQRLEQSAAAATGTAIAAASPEGSAAAQGLSPQSSTTNNDDERHASPWRAVIVPQHSSADQQNGSVIGGSSINDSSPRHSPSLSTITTDEDTCGICFDNSNHVAIKYCGHRLCVDCYRKVWELSGTESTCPFCRARLEGYLYLDWPLGT